MKPNIKKYFAYLILFLGGLVIGAVLFAPWEMVWSNVLNTVAQRMPVPMTWKSVGENSMTSMRVHGLVLAAPKGIVEIAELRVKLGVSPLARVTVRTGAQVLNISASLDGALSLGGGIDVGALLPGRGMDGGLSLSGDFFFDSWSRPPSSGTLAASASTLQLPSGMRIEQMQLAADLAGQDLNLKSFTLERPVAVTGAGAVRLDYGNFFNSNIDVFGTVKIGPSETKFKKVGPLKSLM